MDTNESELVVYMEYKINRETTETLQTRYAEVTFKYWNCEDCWENSGKEEASTQENLFLGGACQWSAGFYSQPAQTILTTLLSVMILSHVCATITLFHNIPVV